MAKNIFQSKTENTFTQISPIFYKDLNSETVKKLKNDIRDMLIKNEEKGIDIQSFIEFYHKKIKQTSVNDEFKGIKFCLKQKNEQLLDEETVISAKNGEILVIAWIGTKTK